MPTQSGTQYCVYKGTLNVTLYPLYNTMSGGFGGYVPDPQIPSNLGFSVTADDAPITYYDSGPTAAWYAGSGGMSNHTLIEPGWNQYLSYPVGSTPLYTTTGASASMAYQDQLFVFETQDFKKKDAIYFKYFYLAEGPRRDTPLQRISYSGLQFASQIVNTPMTVRGVVAIAPGVWAFMLVWGAGAGSVAPLILYNGAFGDDYFAQPLTMPTLSGNISPVSFVGMDLSLGENYLISPTGQLSAFHFSPDLTSTFMDQFYAPVQFVGGNIDGGKLGSNGNFVNSTNPQGWLFTPQNGPWDASRVMCLASPSFDRYWWINFDFSSIAPGDGFYLPYVKLGQDGMFYLMSNDGMMYGSYNPGFPFNVQPTIYDTRRIEPFPLPCMSPCITANIGHTLLSA